MHPALAYAALVAAAALWGSNGVAARLVGADIPPITLSWLRWLVALAALAPFAWKDRGAIALALRRDWRILLPLALLANVPQSALVYVGLQTTTVMNIGLLNSTIPVLILVLAALFFSRPAAGREIVGIAISFAGVATILFQGSLERVLALSLNRGDLLAFGSPTAGARSAWARCTPAFSSISCPSLRASSRCSCSAKACGPITSPASHW
jgi:drug/metabolite transporter (DMT)-like permease